MLPERTQARANPARGLALIATAVVIGFFLLRNGFDQGVPDLSAAEASQSGDEGDAAAGNGEGGGSSTTAAPAARAPAEVTVLVANASGVGGAAGQLTESLAQHEYRTLEATNAQGPALETTVVVFQPGYDADAAALSERIGASAPPQPLSNPPQGQVDPTGANLVVLLGTDLASA